MGEKFSLDQKVIVFEAAEWKKVRAKKKKKENLERLWL